MHFGPDLLDAVELMRQVRDQLGFSLAAHCTRAEMAGQLRKSP
jgi:hypothetical protein